MGKQKANKVKSRDSTTLSSFSNSCFPVHTRLLYLFALVGMLVAMYGYYVEWKERQLDDYVAMCDLSPVISCTKILTSKYCRLLSLFGFTPAGGVFDIPNTVIGRCANVTRNFYKNSILNCTLL